MCAINSDPLFIQLLTVFCLPNEKIYDVYISRILAILFQKSDFFDFLSASYSCSRFYIFIIFLFLFFHNLVKVEQFYFFWNNFISFGTILFLLE